MKPVIMFRKNSENLKSSVYGSHEYGCNYAIAAHNESMLRKRGFHLTDDEVKDILHNIPKDLKKYVRFIDDESKVAHYQNDSEEVQDKFEEAKDSLKKEVNSEEAVQKEAVQKEATPLNDVDYSNYTEDELNEFRNELKQYAKNNNIKLHPALRDIPKIIAKIKEKSNG